MWTYQLTSHLFGIPVFCFYNLKLKKKYKKSNESEILAKFTHSAHLLSLTLGSLDCQVQYRDNIVSQHPEYRDKYHIMAQYIVSPLEPAEPLWLWPRTVSHLTCLVKSCDLF